MSRHLAAAIVAGIAAPSAVILTINMWQLLAGGNNSGVQEWSLAWRLNMSLIPMSYAIPAVLLYGLPVFLLLRRLRLANVYTCVLTALAPIGVAAQAGWLKDSTSLKKGLLYGAFFLISGLSFWIFARKAVVNAPQA